MPTWYLLSVFHFDVAIIYSWDHSQGCPAMASTLTPSKPHISLYTHSYLNGVTMANITSRMPCCHIVWPLENDTLWCLPEVEESLSMGSRVYLQSLVTARSELLMPYFMVNFDTLTRNQITWNKGGYHFSYSNNFNHSTNICIYIYIYIHLIAIKASNK